MKRMALILALAPATAFAVESAPYSYVGAGGSWLQLDVDGFEEADLGGGYLKLGHMINDRLGFEVRGTYTGEDSARIDGTDVDADLQVDFAYSTFARWNFLETSSDIQVYALLGGTAGKATAEVDAADAQGSAREIDWSAGVGVELYGNESTAVTADVIRYMDKDDVELYGANIGFSYRF